MFSKQTLADGWLASVVICAAFLVSRTAIAAPPVLSNPELAIDYTVVENYPGADFTFPYGINTAGDVSGTAYVDGFSGSIGFLWHKATNSFTTIDLGSGGFTFGHGVSDAGVVVGDYVDGFFGQDTTAYSEIGFALDTTTSVVATDPSFLFRGISNAGDLAGYTQPQADGTTQAFRYWQGHVETFSCFGAPNMFGEGINVAGDVVGIYADYSQNYSPEGAFLYRNGKCSDISIPGAVSTRAWGINDRGDIVGEYWGYFGGGVCFFGAFYRHDNQVEVTRIECGSNGWHGNSNKVASLISINNDRVVVGELDAANPNGTMFYGTVRGAKAKPR